MEPITTNTQTDEQRRYEQLQWTGWSATGIKRLQLFRSTYAQTALDQPSLDQRRLEFVRWLVLTGKLSEWR
jgi:hypothetical protein